MLEDNSNNVRDQLRLAIERKDAASKRLAQATMAVSNAKEIVEICAAEFDSFDGLDAEIIAFRAERIEAWSASGRSEGRPSMDLSEDLATRLQRRRETYDELIAAKTAHASLSEKRAQAQKDFATAETASRAAADAVVVLDGEAVAKELALAQTVTDALRLRLRAFLRVDRPAPTGMGYMPLLRSGKLRDLAEYPRSPFTSAMIDPEGTELANWRSYQQRLLTDPNSTLE